MTPDELEAAVNDGDPARVIALLSTSTEAERRACGARMVVLRKERGDWPGMAAGPRENETTLIALMGTGTAAQIRDGRRMFRHASAGTVLRLRPRELLVDLVPWMLDRLGWRFVRELVREGRIPRPSGDDYIVGMLDGFIDAPGLLRDDPDLVDHEVWRLFEVEGTGDHSLADHDKYSPDTKTWSRALMDLAGTQLDRGRLLDASLAALERDFPAFRAGWYSRFHEALEPTATERADRVDVYLRLLRSPVAPTVSFGVRALSAVQKAGRLDGGQLLASIEPALTVRAAGTAREGLRLVERAVLATPTLAAAARRPTAAALGHASPEVQMAALSIFEARLGPLDEAAVALLAGHRDDLAASVLPMLDALVGAAHEGPTGLARDTHHAGAERPFVDAPAIEPRQPFDGLERLAPIASVQDLVESFASILEREGPPERLELVLDACLRLCGERPEDLARITKAVRVRADRVIAASRQPSIATWFATLVWAWADHRLPDEGKPMHGESTGWLARRVAAVAREVAAGRPRALVALPSYAGGWIEPSELVMRLATVQQAGDHATPALILDVAQALLRVLPVGRDAALAAAADLTGEIGDAVRHALGGTTSVGPTAALWAAAARCRAPGTDDPSVANAHPGLGPDGGLAGRYALVVGQGRYGRQPQLDPGMVTVEPRDDVPTDLLWRVSAQATGGGDKGAIVDWARLIWPQDRRSWFATSAALLLDNLDWWEARWHDRRRLEPLFEPWTPLGREASMLLAVALQAKEPGQRGLAVDAAAEAVADGRLPAESVVAGFDEVATALEVQPASKYPITLFRPARLARSLEEVARRSDVHQAWALAVAAGALERAQRVQRPEPVSKGQLTPLLRLLVELCVQLGCGVPERARTALRELSASAGEGGRLARSLSAVSAQER